MKERGSISIFFSFLLPFFLVVLLLLSELSYYHFQRQKVISENYLNLDDALSLYNRELFNEMGLLAYEGRGGLYPLSDTRVLRESILLLMKEAHLRDGITFAEDLVSEFLKSRLGLDFELFDLGELNRDLASLVASAKKGELSEALSLEFFARALAMQPYVHLKGLSLSQLEKYIREGNIEALEEIRPIFVLDETLRENYATWRETLEKYDRLNLLGSYALADYGVDYLGYSMTQMDKEDLRCEYLLSGLVPGVFQEGVIKAELYALRLMLNLNECFFNPRVREGILARSGGEPRLFILFALAQAGLESSVDVLRLMNREKVPLYKGKEGFSTLGKSGRYLQGWSYPDYLKILLGMMPEKLYFSRLKHALEHNYDLILEWCYTGLESERRLFFKGRYLPFEVDKKMKGRLYYVQPPEG